MKPEISAQLAWKAVCDVMRSYEAGEMDTPRFVCKITELIVYRFAPADGGTDLEAVARSVQAMLDKIPGGLELSRAARVYQTHLKLALMHLKRAEGASGVSGDTPGREEGCP